MQNRQLLGVHPYHCHPEVTNLTASRIFMHMTKITVILSKAKDLQC